MQNTGTTTDLAHFRPMDNDEIDLGQLIRNLLVQWKLIAIFTLLGAVVGVCIALLIPKQYRVEAMFDKPSNAELAPLLGQPYIELDRQKILSDFLKNLKSRDLIEKVLTENNLLTGNDGAPLTEAEQFTQIRNVAANIRIAPAEFDFLPELKDTTSEIDQISYSLLTANPQEGQTLLNGLLKLATEKTTRDYINDINGARAIQKQQLANQLVQLKDAALAAKAAQIAEFTKALAIAKSLNINDSAQWTGSSDDLYLKGTRVLTAELAYIEQAEPKLGSIIVSYDQEGLAQTLSAESVKGQLGAIDKFEIDQASISFVSDNTRAYIPADAEKPNRKLIAIAATVLAGFLGLFVALIRVAIRPN
ncbi:Wzz/FepE/Etk N-terminal domain-containing protein [Reinekea sp. G2M2-21]|uniref:Wzz/FepE/Etk N-terminal domain-containing protein n=1 Tax=Reinekea sp. G2M2-21 TaxID=2788942 RepID=UPI0018AC27D2|nr:Wzz/FepE/Etk N-terminal domain-containing protein [Reinekea sp. G2M2-21]